jgi:hypothetical protein
VIGGVHTRFSTHAYLYINTIVLNDILNRHQGDQSGRIFVVVRFVSCGIFLLQYPKFLDYIGTFSMVIHSYVLNLTKTVSGDFGHFLQIYLITLKGMVQYVCRYVLFISDICLFR